MDKDKMQKFVTNYLERKKKYDDTLRVWIWVEKSNNGEQFTYSHSLAAFLDKKVTSDMISNDLHSCNMFEIKVNQAEKKLEIENLSTYEWKIIYNDERGELCRPGEIKELFYVKKIIIDKSTLLSIIEIEVLLGSEYQSHDGILPIISTLSDDEQDMNLDRNLWEEV